MIAYIIGLIAALGFLMAYKMVIRPRKEYESCIMEFQKRGFKVKKLGFIPFGAAFIRDQKNDEILGDAMRAHKKDYPGYDVTVSNLFNIIRIQLISPQLLKDFFSQNHIDDFPKNAFVHDLLKRYIGEGLTIKQGKQWRKRRTLMGKIFNFDLIKSFIPNIKELCDEAIDYIESKNLTDSDGFLSFKVNEVSGRIFSNVVVESFMGGNMRKEEINGIPHYVFMQKTFNDGMAQGFQLMSQLFGVKYLNLGVWESHRDINQRLVTLKGWARCFIEERGKVIREQIKKGDIKKESPKNILQAIIFQTEDLNNQQLLQEFLTFFVAGTDTSTLYLQMMVYYITSNPRIQEKLRQQIECNMQNDDYSFENLKKFKYIDCIFKQTTRYYGPIVHVAPRDANKDCLLAGVPIKKGTILTTSDLANQYNPKYFNTPQQFRPQRWESQCDDVPPFVLGGFGGGARTCIGKHLAMLETKIALISLFKRYSTIIGPKEQPRMIAHALYEPMIPIVLKVKKNG